MEKDEDGAQVGKRRNRLGYVRPTKYVKSYHATLHQEHESNEDQELGLCSVMKDDTSYQKTDGEQCCSVTNEAHKDTSNQKKDPEQSCSLINEDASIKKTNYEQSCSAKQVKDDTPSQNDEQLPKSDFSNFEEEWRGGLAHSVYDLLEDLQDENDVLTNLFGEWGHPVQEDLFPEDFDPGIGNENADLEDPEHVEENMFKDEPIYSGHTLTVKVSMLLIWLFATKYNLTASQFSDLLTLINMHMMLCHPAFKSLHRFKRYFSKLDSPVIKHFYCSICLTVVSKDAQRCPNTYCGRNLTTSGAKKFFVEVNIEAQLRTLFARSDFTSLIKHRFTRHKRCGENIEDVYDGFIYKQLTSNDGPLSKPCNVSFTLNTDGVPIFKSSKMSAWPVYLMINELPYKYRKRTEFMILAGLWYGDKKPSMTTFMEPLNESLKKLEQGIDVVMNGVQTTCKGFLLCFSADLPARSSVLNMNQFNGAHSCIKCTQRGENFRTESGGNIHVFPFIEEDHAGPARQADDIRSSAMEAQTTKTTKQGIKGPSYLIFNSYFNPVRGIAIDYMHCILLGVTRLLVRLWFTTTEINTYSLSSFVNLVDARIARLKPPHTITRLPRSISEHFKFWKAAELRSWLFYYSVPVLIDIMKPRFWYHYCAFVAGISILCQDSISVDDIETSKTYLRYFVFMFESLYGKQFLTMNIHSLLHLPDNVLDLGPLWSVSCFPFENANGELLKMFHGTQHVDMQIVSAVNVIQNLPLLTDMVTTKSTEVRAFIQHLLKTDKLSALIPKSCNFVGKGYSKQIPETVLQDLKKFLKCDPSNIVFYNRAVIHNTMYHSLDYARVTSRNSYTVQYFDTNMTVQFGHILWFAECVIDNNTSQLCCISQLKPADLNIVMPANKIYPDNFSNFLKIDIPYMNPVLKDHAFHAFVPVDNIVSLCVCVVTDDLTFVCTDINQQEKNL